MSEIIPKPINDFWNPIINGETFMDFQNYCEKEEKLSADDEGLPKSTQVSSLG